MHLKSFITMFLLVAFVISYLQIPVFAQHLNKYHYDRATTQDEDDGPESHLMEKKKKKGKKPASPPSQPQPQIEEAPACNPPECVIQDPILPDEICNNDCPQGSGRHCQGRHNMFTHELYAICVPD